MEKAESSGRSQRLGGRRTLIGEFVVDRDEELLHEVQEGLDHWAGAVLALFS